MWLNTIMDPFNINKKMNGTHGIKKCNFSLYVDLQVLHAGTISRSPNKHLNPKISKHYYI